MPDCPAATGVSDNMGRDVFYVPRTIVSALVANPLILRQVVSPLLDHQNRVFGLIRIDRWLVRVQPRLCVRIDWAKVAGVERNSDLKLHYIPVHGLRCCAYGFPQRHH